jgi:hypothetical protein
MTETSFDRVISEHLALCERNKRLERRMPLDHYRDGKPPQAAPDAVTTSREGWLDHESFWDTSGERPLPEFDWGDD